MEEWLSNPVQQRYLEDQLSRRSSNANSRAATRIHTRAATRTHSRHGSVQLFERLPFSLNDDDSLSHYVVENSSRFPLSKSTLDLLTTPYLRNLDGGEIIYERDAEKVSQPIADVMDDDDDFLFLLEEDDESNDDDATRQDRVFMNNVTRS